MTHKMRWIGGVVFSLLAVQANAAAPPATQPGEADTFWSMTEMDTTPSGVRFHGPFTNGICTITAEQMPAHDWLEINVDLLILRSWDGSVPVEPSGKHPVTGPDYLMVDLEKGPNLLYTTFSNTPDNPPGFLQTSQSQNFPSYVPGEKFKFQTGSAERNTLGYAFDAINPPPPVPMDAVYKLHWLVPHTGPEANLRIAALGLQDMNDESWGLRSVSIKPLHDAQVPLPADADIAAAFDTSLKTDTDQGQFEAFNTLVCGRGQTVQWISKNVAAAPINAETMNKLIADLGGDEQHIAERKAGMRALREMGPQVEPALRDARRDAPGEKRTRIDATLQALGVTPITDDGIKRVMLATRVLEVIGTPEAMALRKQLVQQ